MEEAEMKRTNGEVSADITEEQAAKDAAQVKLLTAMLCHQLWGA